MNEDGIVIFYKKDGILYPVALTEAQYAIISGFISEMFDSETPMKVILDKPIGKIKNLVKNRDVV